MTRAHCGYSRAFPVGHGFRIPHGRQVCLRLCLFHNQRSLEFGLLVRFGLSERETQATQAFRLRGIHAEDARVKSSVDPLGLCGVPVLIVVTTVGLCLYVRSGQTDKELTENNGSLVPASDPTPTNACSDNPLLKKDDYIILLGNEVAIFRTFPHTVIAVHRTVSLLWFTIDKDGGIEVNADIHSPDMKLVAKCGFQ